MSRCANEQASKGGKAQAAAKNLWSFFKKRQHIFD
jgi:hypothetical protein